MARNRLEKRKCPVCGLQKVFEVRSETCSNECGAELRRRRMAAQAEARLGVAAMPKLGAIPPAIEHRIKRENSRLRSDLARQIEEAERSSRYHAFVEECLAAPRVDPPAWVRTAKAGAKQAIPTAFLSDTHFGETVAPEQVEYLNAYDREIAEARLKRFFTNTCVLAKDFLRGLSWGGIVLPLGGDIFSGDIHEELARTNAGPTPEELLHWIDPMVAGIRLLADEFGKVHVPAVVGNHPRLTHKPSHKMRVPNNFDWLFYRLLERELRADKRVTWAIGASADVDYRVYDTRYRLSHGDQFRGGSGIAGALSPLMIGDARKRRRAQATSNEYDWLVLGHWHQRMMFKRVAVNGSLKGYDEFAYDCNFEFEPPQQSFWLTDPQHGVTIAAPIHCLGKDEAWLAKAPANVQKAA